MTILDLIKKTAIIFNVDDILRDFDLNNLTNDMQSMVLNNNSQLNRMFELAKVVLSEVYSYASKEVEVTVNSVDKCISKNMLGAVGRIVWVKNKLGRVNYYLKDNEIVVERDDEYVVKCVVAPDVRFLTNKIDMLNGCISEDLLVSGLNAYHCLTSGLFEEYNVYNSRYIDGFSRIKNPKLFAMPCRSWHE